MMADSEARNPATVYNTMPNEAAIRTMQIATKIVEMRIIDSARPQPLIVKPNTIAGIRWSFFSSDSATYPLPAARGGTPICRAYATARIVFATLSTISPIWSSEMISGGVSAMVSPVTRSSTSCSW